MSEFKGTPGPWAITGDPDHFAGLQVEAAKEGIIHWVIAERVGGQVTGDNFDNYSIVEANAKLIAAAPDLLEALFALVQVNESHNCAMEKVIGRPTNWNDSYLDAARAAIAKATA